MYYKITNCTDVNCLEQYLLESHENKCSHEALFVVRYLYQMAQTLEDCYMKNEAPDIRGGAIFFYNEPIDIEKEQSRKEVLKRYHLTDKDCEIADKIKREDDNCRWYQEIYIMTELNIMFVYRKV